MKERINYFAGIDLGSTMTKVVIIDGNEEIGFNDSLLCYDGRYKPLKEDRERVTSPMVRRNGQLEPISWDEALDLVAGRLTQIRDAHGGDSIGVLTSARITNEENYIAQKFARAVLKTNNVDHCARL